MSKPNFKNVTDVDELLKLIYDEADHILGVIGGIKDTGTGKMPKPLTMVKTDAKAIQQYAKRAMKKPGEK